MATVLVVEDEWAIADWLQSLLAEEGYGVTVASNGRQALDILKHEKPDLVLTDFMMPILDGQQLLAAIRKDPALADIPVVFMSSLQEPAVRQRADGYRAFLRKPFRETELLRVLEQVLGPKA